MKYNKTVALKDGRTCVIRNGTEQDAEGVLANFILTHSQTDFLTTYPDEIIFTLDQERAYLKGKEESECEAELIAEVGGLIVGTAGVSRRGTAEKVRHRASFGISINRDYWGIGIGRALAESCIECAVAAGYVQIELEAVAENKRALALYQSVGFIEYGRNPKAFLSRSGRWQENVLMRLELDRQESPRPFSAG